MVELYDADLFEEARPSSKGNQLKWKTTDDHWYKADGNGCEGLAEYVVSSLLSQSDLQQEEFVHYETERILYKKLSTGDARAKTSWHPESSSLPWNGFFDSSTEAASIRQFFKYLMWKVG